MIHTAKKPEPEIPEKVEVPDFAHLLPEPIRRFTLPQEIHDAVREPAERSDGRHHPGDGGDGGGAAVRVRQRPALRERLGHDEDHDELDDELT